VNEWLEYIHGYIRTGLTHPIRLPDRNQDAQLHMSYGMSATQRMRRNLSTSQAVSALAKAGNPTDAGSYTLLESQMP
jgi:hypothetical protein